MQIETDKELEEWRKRVHSDPAFWASIKDKMNPDDLVLHRKKNPSAEDLKRLAKIREYVLSELRSRTSST